MRMRMEAMMGYSECGDGDGSAGDGVVEMVAVTMLLEVEVAVGVLGVRWTWR